MYQGLNSSNSATVNSDLDIVDRMFSEGLNEGMLLTPAVIHLGSLRETMEKAQDYAAAALDRGDFAAAENYEAFHDSVVSTYTWLAAFIEGEGEGVLMVQALMAYRLHRASAVMAGSKWEKASALQKEEAEEEYDWVTCEYAGSGSFLQVCQALGHDPEIIRAGILAKTRYLEADTPKRRIVAMVHNRAPVEVARKVAFGTNWKDLATVTTAAWDATKDAAAAVIKQVRHPVASIADVIHAVATSMRGLRTRLCLGAAAVAALFTTASAFAAGPVQRDMKNGNDASEQVGLSTYLTQAIASLKPKTAPERELQRCVATLTDLAPGGGDANAQQRSVSSEVSLPVLMQRALREAAKDNQTAQHCSSQLQDNLALRTTNPSAEVLVDFQGRVVDRALDRDFSDIVGRKLLCVQAMAEVSRSVLQELKASPMATEDDAVAIARRRIGQDLRAATNRAYKATAGAMLAVPVRLADNNLGSSRPYAPVMQGGLIMGTQGAFRDPNDRPKYVGSEVNALAERTAGAQSLAIGGFLSWQASDPATGLTARWDGSNFSVAKFGQPYYDANTLDGASTKVSLNASGSYTASSKSVEPQQREGMLRQMATCALAMNNVAQQVAPALLKPARLPAPSAASTQQLLRTARVRDAFDMAASQASGHLDTDYSQGGIRWRIGPYGFAKDGGSSRSGVQVTMGGGILWDDSHIAGRSYTVSATGSVSNSTGYKTERGQ